MKIEIKIDDWSLESIELTDLFKFINEVQNLIKRKSNYFTSKIVQKSRSYLF